MGVRGYTDIRAMVGPSAAPSNSTAHHVRRVSPQGKSPQDSPARAGARTVLDDGASTVAGSSAMTIRPEFTKRQSIVVITVMVWLADGVVSSMVVPRRGWSGS